MQHTVESLIAFRDRVKEAFEAKKIPAPVHLPGGNEQQIIEIFKRIRPQDWVFSQWRSAYHALLKGITEEELFDMIVDKRSMYIMSRPHRFFASSIVGGTLPIACGRALKIKREGWDQRVYCFIGDMTATTGVAATAMKFRDWWGLPIDIICEDNSYSTDTPTSAAWHGQTIFHCTEQYSYTRTTPHVGTGKHVQF